MGRQKNWSSKVKEKPAQCDVNVKYVHENGKGEEVKAKIDKNCEERTISCKVKVIKKSRDTRDA